MPLRAETPWPLQPAAASEYSGARTTPARHRAPAGVHIIGQCMYVYISARCRCLITGSKRCGSRFGPSGALGNGAGGRRSSSSSARGSATEEIILGRARIHAVSSGQTGLIGTIAKLFSLANRLPHISLSLSLVFSFGARARSFFFLPNLAWSEWTSRAREEASKWSSFCLQRDGRAAAARETGNLRHFR